jgi:predicted protein tyrosine phosphatase
LLHTLSLLIEPLSMKTIRKNLLFVCSRNKRRSLTAEMIWADSDVFSVKSCGTSPASRVKISEKLIHWSDMILVMEKRHKEILLQQFGDSLQGKKIIVLFIPDDYDLMDSELIEILESRVVELGF